VTNDSNFSGSQSEQNEVTGTSSTPIEIETSAAIAGTNETGTHSSTSTPRVILRRDQGSAELNGMLSRPFTLRGRLGYGLDKLISLMATKKIISNTGSPTRPNTSAAITAIAGGSGIQSRPLPQSHRSFDRLPVPTPTARNVSSVTASSPSFTGRNCKKQL
jgi:hypothetical protein